VDRDGFGREARAPTAGGGICPNNPLGPVVAPGAASVAPGLLGDELPPTAIIIPAVGRPGRVAPLLDNVRRVTPEPHRVYVVVEEHDSATREAVRSAGAAEIVLRGTRGYPTAINTAYEVTTEPVFFCGADDLVFHRGWLTAALAKLRGHVRVVGANDLHHPDVLAGLTATHYLVARSYIEERGGTVDRSYPVLFAYDHNYSDTEFVATARSRGVFAYAPAAVVEHRHPHWGGAADDATYQKGRRAIGRDFELFQRRRSLWEGVRREP
jgi:hypothetical protein